jgi:hypothetical protein
MKVVFGAELVTGVSDAIVRRVAQLGHDVVQMSGLGWADVDIVDAFMTTCADLPESHQIALCRTAPAP